MTEKRRGEKGQTVVEYLLTTLTLVIAFSGLYGYLQRGLKSAFQVAGIKILTPYCKWGPCRR